jgi:hypothetical protein|tara:strand:- start:750 stop:1460 length:711 start_codon:yes stop_codon:yes gene_type:complete
MNKQKLTGFVEKYSLGNTIESVPWSIKSNTLTTEFVSEDRTLLGSVTLNSFAIDDAEIGIYNTTQLQKMISVLGSDVTVNLKKADKRAIAIDMTDGDVSLNYMLADLDIIPKAPKLKTLPDTTVVIEINNDFITKFVRAKNALSESDNFTVISNTITQIIIGESDSNTNKININVKTESSQAMSAISFNANYLKEILAANRDHTDGKMEVCAGGLAILTFSNADYTSKYYLVQTNV